MEAVYLSPGLLFLGDRASATLYYDGTARIYARGRLRFNSLTPSDHAEWAGLRARKWEVEGGFGAQTITPVGIVTLRADTDLINRSRGQNAVVSLDLPLLRKQWLFMPSLTLIWRSSNLANYYYGGVSHAEATADHPYYDVGAALSASVALIGSYRFTDRWVGALLANYERYPTSIRNSPLIGKAGSYDLIAGFGYNF